MLFIHLYQTLGDSLLKGEEKSISPDRRNVGKENPTSKNVTTSN